MTNAGPLEDGGYKIYTTWFFTNSNHGVFIHTMEVFDFIFFNNIKPNLWNLDFGF